MYCLKVASWKCRGPPKPELYDIIAVLPISEAGYFLSKKEVIYA